MSKVFSLIAVFLALFCVLVIYDSAANSIIKEANLEQAGNDLVLFCDINGPADLEVQFVSQEGSRVKELASANKANVTGLQRINLGPVAGIEGRVYITARSDKFWRVQMEYIDNHSHPIN